MEMQRIDSAVELPPQKGTGHAGPPSRVRSPSRAQDEALANQDSRPRPQSRLLSLPPELQLSIWEFVVIQDEPLYINCPCDSSFGGWSDEYYAQVELWENGTKHPPPQPGLTRVCRSIRADALPMFFKYNKFQSGYCYETNTEMTLDWLRTMGGENRQMMREFYFFDANCRHDINNSSKDLKRIQRSDAVRKMGGVMTSVYTDEYCRHDVSFRDKDEDEGLDGLSNMLEQLEMNQ